MRLGLSKSGLPARLDFFVGVIAQQPVRGGSQMPIIGKKVEVVICDTGRQGAGCTGLRCWRGASCGGDVSA